MEYEILEALWGLVFGGVIGWYGTKMFLVWKNGHDS